MPSIRLHAARTTGAGVIVVALLLATACTDDHGPTAETKAHLALSHWSPRDASDQALMQGALAVRDGCVVIEGPDGSVGVPAWPRSLVSWDDARSVLTYAGREYGVGDTISAGGGVVTGSRVAEVGLEYPAQCGDLANGNFFAVEVETLG